MTTAFLPNQIFVNTNRASFTQSQKNQVKEDYLKPLNLGQVLQYPKYNYFDEQFGHPLNLHYPPAYIRPPPPPPSRPTSQLLNTTNNMLVDVSGYYYKNKDLKQMKYKSYGQ